MLIQVKVKPNSKKFSLKLKKDVLFINLRSPAEKGKANQELIKQLRKTFGSCEIVKGKGSTNKILKIPIDLNTLKKKNL